MSNMGIIFVYLAINYVVGNICFIFVPRLNMNFALDSKTPFLRQ